MEPNNIKLILSYDGTNYNGFQSQRNNSTIEEKIRHCLKVITAENISIYCAGRTDSGVHAQGQVINFYTDKFNMNEDNWLNALNTLLPWDIRVLSCNFVDINFHARKNCLAREYIYLIINSNVISALENRFSVRYKYPLDIKILQKYCNELVGEYDFSSFCSALDKNKSKVKKIFLIKLEKMNDLITIRIIGNAFLHHMVRIIIGTILKLNKFSMPQEEIKKILLSKKRYLAGSTFAARGLIFQKAYYEKEELKKEISRNINLD